MHIYLLQLI